MKPTLRIAAIILALSNLTSFGHAQTIEKKSLTIDGAQKVIAAAVASRQSTRTIWPGAMPTARRFILARIRVCYRMRLNIAGVRPNGKMITANKR